MGGKIKGSGIRRSHAENNFDNLRDDVAGALDDDGIAGADILARDFIGIVQGRPADDHAADGHRPQFGHGGQRTGAADLELDV